MTKYTNKRCKWENTLAAQEKNGGRGGGKEEYFDIINKYT